MDEPAATTPVERRITIERTARYYESGGGAAAPELWYALHGYGQLASRFLTSFDAIAADARRIIAPEGLHRFYLDPIDVPAHIRRVGATWMTREDRDTDIADYVRYLDRLHAAVAAHDTARVIVFGFSQGTATACRWIAQGRVLPTHLVLWGAGLPPDLDWSSAAERLARCRILLVAGERDPMTSEERVQQELATLAEHGLQADLLRYPGGHRVQADGLAGVVSWLA